LHGDKVVDRFDQSIALVKLESLQNNFLLNGKDFKLYGVTYSPSYYQYGSLSSYDRMESDLEKLSRQDSMLSDFPKNFRTHTI